MVYVRKGPYVNVENADAPPAGAKHIDAEYLNGVEDYLAAQDTANAKFDAKVRVDTTVGKRVFVKDAAGVEHLVSADTGWRNMAANMNPNFVTGSASKVFVKREGITVSWLVRVYPGAGVVGLSRRALTDFIPVPVGFRQTPDLYGSVGTGTVSSFDPISFNNRAGSGAMSISGSTGNWATGDITTGVFSYTTTEPWPTTLPGTPG